MKKCLPVSICKMTTHATPQVTLFIDLYLWVMAKIVIVSKFIKAMVYITSNDQ